MWETLQNIFGPIVTAVGTVVVAGGGLATIAYGLFRFFGEKWLTSKFDERLAAYKHAQQRELEHLRFEINSLLDRSTKLHQREFEVLPQAWSLFNDAYWQINGIMGFKMRPDLSSMSDVQLEEFLKKSKFADWQKQKIKSATDKTKQYGEYEDWLHIGDAYKAYGEWQVFFLKNAIFMTNEIKKKFSEVDQVIKGALIEQEMRIKEKDIKFSEMKDFNKLLHEGRNLRDALEAEVQSRLWSSTKHLIS